MDWFPLYNSLRIAAVSTVLIFFLGIAAAYYVARTPRWIKGLLDVLFTLPLVLPPTVAYAAGGTRYLQADLMLLTHAGCAFKDPRRRFGISDPAAASARKQPPAGV